MFRNVNEVKSAENREHEIFMRIKDKHFTVESNMDDLAEAGWKLDMFRSDTLEKMTENKDYTMRIFVRAAQSLTAVDNKVRAVRN